MNCEEIQTGLSEYLDQSLDAISTKSIEVHLATCSRCRIEADSLAECIQQVIALPMIDPPLGFTQRVMIHIDEIESQPTIWQRLFLPLRVKIPLQATAVVLIGALAVILSQKESQLKKQDFSEPPASTMTPAAPSEKIREQRKDSAIVAERFVKNEKPAKPTAKPPADFAKKAIKEIQSDKAVAAPAVVQQTQPAAPTAAKLEGESRLEDKKEAPRRPPIPAQEISTSGDALRSRGDTFGLGAAAGTLRQPSLRSGAFLAERSLSPLSEPSADVEFVVRRRPRERRDQKETGGSDSAQSPVFKRAAPASQPSSIIEIRWFTVPVDRFEQFRKELTAEATIESERTPGVIENDLAQKIGRELLIKVNIVSPSDR